MIRETSAAAYKKIKDEGLLSKRRFEVYELLFRDGPSTGSELAVSYSRSVGILAPNAGNIVTRLGELRDQGVVVEKRNRTCSITGMTVTEWEVTDKLPTSLPKRDAITSARKKMSEGFDLAVQALKAGSRVDKVDELDVAAIWLVSRKKGILGFK